jgi:diguanylate cyclase (GGDEF)-like protein
MNDSVNVVHGSPFHPLPALQGAVAPAAVSEFATLRLDLPEERHRGNVLRTTKLFVVFVCLVLLVTNGWLVVRARAHDIAQAAVANTNLARAVTEQVEGTIAEADRILETIVFEIERSEPAGVSLLRLQPVLVNHVAAAPQLKGLFIYDRRGNWIVHSEPSWDGSRNNADRAYFIHHRDNRSRKAWIGAPIQSRSSGEWVVPVSRRIDDPEGTFRGVALATISIAHLHHLLDKFEVGEQGAIALTLSEQLLVRRPFLEADIGKRLGTAGLMKLFASERSGSVDARSTLDGVQRIISFEHTQNYPLLVTVAVGKDEALDDWRTTSYFQTALALLLCAVVGVAGTYVIRAMRLRVDAELGLRETRDALTEANERLSQLAQYDGLTGLPNRRYFDARLMRVFQQAQSGRQQLAIVMVDVDEFKKYNDLYGHMEGDACLKQVTAALQSAARRPDDFVARYGGEEMVLLLPQTDALSAARVAEVARQAVAALRIPHAATALGHVSVSLGVAAWVPGAGSTPDQILKEADNALYRAKRAGRNRVELPA